MEWPVGGLIEGRFEVFDVKREGSSILYVCYDHQQHGPVALRTYTDRALASPLTRGRFVENANAWRRLGAHEHITRAFEVREIEGKPHILVEFIDPSPGGTTLRRRLAGGLPPLTLLLDWALHLCRGMDYLAYIDPSFHHGDLRPENLMVTREGVLKITDFGLLRSLIDLDSVRALDIATGTPLTSAVVETPEGLPLGSPPYLAPERIKGNLTPDVRSDIYSAGCILYEMAFGQWLFSETRVDRFLEKHLTDEPTLPPDAPDQVARLLWPVIQRCLAKAPADRIPDFATLAAELERVREAVVAEMAGGVESEAPAESDAEIGPQPEPEPQPELETQSELKSKLEPEPEPEQEHQPEPATKLWPESERQPEAVEAEAVPSGPTIEGAARAQQLSRDALALARAGNPGEAESMWREALRLDDGLASAHANLGAALAARGAHEEALEHLRRALHLDPGRPRWHYNIGRVYFDLGDLESARLAFQEASGCDPGFGAAHLALGMVCEALGRVSQARMAYDAALACADVAGTAATRLAALNSSTDSPDGSGGQ